MTWRQISSSVAVAVVAMTLAGCGGNDEEPVVAPVSQPASAPATAPATQPAMQPVQPLAPSSPGAPPVVAGATQPNASAPGTVNGMRLPPVRPGDSTSGRGAAPR